MIALLAPILATLWLGGPAPAIGQVRDVQPAGGGQVYRLTLTPARQDYFLTAPRQRRVVFQLDARRAAPKVRLMFRSPLPAGDHHLRLEVTGPADDHTFVVAVPLARGRSAVTVQITGPGRYDFGFWTGNPRSPPKEYRFTVRGPLEERRFDLDLP